MATKDWRKEPGIDSWEKNGYFIEVKHNVSTKWLVIGGNGLRDVKRLKSGFKTKLQALAYAKSYMRSH